jgi:hypothetical protein
MLTRYQLGNIKALLGITSPTIECLKDKILNYINKFFKSSCRDMKLWPNPPGVRRQNYNTGGTFSPSPYYAKIRHSFLSYACSL